MASTLEKIKTLLSTKEESKETKLYAEAVLDDGRILATEDDKMEVGSVVFVAGEDGETEAVAEGEYSLEDGTKIVIDSDSKITQIGDEEAEEETEETVEAEEEDEAKDLGKKYKDMEKRIKELEKAVYGEKEEKEEMAENTVKESPVEEKIEMSKDMINSLVEEVEHLKSQIVELEKQPGAEGFKHNPETTTKKERPNLAKMSTKDRVAFFINNK